MLSFNAKFIGERPFFESGDRYGFFLTIGHIFFSVFSEEKKEFSPSQTLFNKLEKYLPLFIYKNIYFMHVRFRFFSGK